MVESFKTLLRPADQTVDQSKQPEDSMFMIVFGGKNAQTEQMFNDINFLGVPSFQWYVPKTELYKAANGPQLANGQQLANVPTHRLGHTSAIYGDKLVVYGGHVIDGSISDELWTLNLQSLKWTNHGSQSVNSKV
jgi:hypothetical protein